MPSSMCRISCNKCMVNTMIAKIVKCKGCGVKFEHFTRNKTSLKEFCQECLRKKNIENSKRFRSKE